MGEGGHGTNGGAAPASVTDYLVQTTSGQNASGVPGLRVPGGDQTHTTGDWVAVRCTSGSVERIAPAKVRSTQKLKKDAPQPTTVELDRVLRLAVGIVPVVPKDEKVQIDRIDGKERARWNKEPVTYRGFWREGLLERVFPTVTVVATPTMGELTLAEQNAVVLEALTLDALGVESGDEVQLMSVKRSTGDGGGEKFVRVAKTVKAYVDDGYVPRRTVDGDGKRELNTLPQIWMGKSIRDQLGATVDAGADGGCSSVVLISPSRRFVIVDHFREAALVAALGLAAIAVSLPDTSAFKYPMIASAFVLPAALILWRIRTRLR